MIVESIAGKSLNGEKLSGKERIMRAAMAAGSLALDFTGIGEAKDVAVIGGKSIGLILKAGTMLAERGVMNGAQIFKTTAEFMASHPQVTAIAEKYAEGKIREGIHQIKQYQRAA